MSNVYIPSVSLHQQDGGMTIEAFADQHGMTAGTMRNYIKAGRVVGARQDSRSKKWTIYPPAKLVDKAGDAMKPRQKAPSGVLPNHQISATASAAQREQEGQSVGDFGQPAPQVEAEGKRPFASRGFNAFEGSAAGSGGERSAQTATAARTDAVQDVYADAKSVRRILQEAAARMHREGIHYLHLDSREFSQLYAALAHERSRIRKLAGKGLVDVGNLRASDSVWQKMQAMCHEGRLL